MKMNFFQIEKSIVDEHYREISLSNVKYIVIIRIHNMNLMYNEGTQWKKMFLK